MKKTSGIDKLLKIADLFEKKVLKKQADSEYFKTPVTYQNLQLIHRDYIEYIRKTVSFFEHAEQKNKSDKLGDVWIAIGGDKSTIEPPRRKQDAKPSTILIEYWEEIDRLGGRTLKGLKKASEDPTVWGPIRRAAINGKEKCKKAKSTYTG